MNQYTDKQIEDTLNLIDSTILNCEKIQPKLKEGTPQFSLTRNRIKALYISKALFRFGSLALAKPHHLSFVSFLSIEKAARRLP